MVSGSTISSFVPQIITANYVNAPSYLIGCGVATAAVATEMALRALGNAIELASYIPIHGIRVVDERTTESAKENFMANLVGAVFYGVMATNIIPYGPLVAAIIFVAHSLLKPMESTDYSASKLVQRIIKPVLQGMGAV